jgi:hypothetical protein
MPYQREGSQSLMRGKLDYIRKFEPAVDPLDGEFPCRPFCEAARCCAAPPFPAVCPSRVVCHEHRRSNGDAQLFER